MSYLYLAKGFSKSTQERKKKALVWSTNQLYFLLRKRYIYFKNKHLFLKLLK